MAFANVKKHATTGTVNRLDTFDAPAPSPSGFGGVESFPDSSLGCTLQLMDTSGSGFDGSVPPPYYGDCQFSLDITGPGGLNKKIHIKDDVVRSFLDLATSYGAKAVGGVGQTQHLALESGANYVCAIDLIAAATFNDTAAAAGTYNFKMHASGMPDGLMIALVLGGNVIGCVNGPLTVEGQSKVSGSLTI